MRNKITSTAQTRSAEEHPPQGVGAEDASQVQEANGREVPSEERQKPDDGLGMRWDRCAKCADTLWSYENANVKMWKEEIDTLLLFAGLFATVLTAFNIAYYTVLQGSNQVPVTAAISNSYFAAAERISPVIVNGLWFSALSLTLITASISIIVRTWLNHSTRFSTFLTTHERIHLWHFRRRGLANWKVPEIIGWLPFLLQIALIIFLCGLILFLDTLSPLIAYIISAMVVSLGFFIVATVASTLMTPECPYKLPQTWYFLVFATKLWGAIVALIRAIRHIFSAAKCSSKAWRMESPPSATTLMEMLQRRRKILTTMLERPEGPISYLLIPGSKRWNSPFYKLPNDWTAFEEHCLNVNDQDDLALLVEVDAAAKDDTFLEDVIRPRLRAASAEEALSVLIDILNHRAIKIRNPTKIRDPTVSSLIAEERGLKTIAQIAQITVDAMYTTLGALNESETSQSRETHLSGTLEEIIDILGQLVSVNSVIVDQLMAFVEACTIWPLPLPSYNALTASKALTLVTSYLERLNSPDLVKPTKLRPVTWTVAGEKTIALLEHVWQDGAKNPKICEAVLESLSRQLLHIPSSEPLTYLKLLKLFKNRQVLENAEAKLTRVMYSRRDRFDFGRAAVAKDDVLNLFNHLPNLRNASNFQSFTQRMVSALALARSLPLGDRLMVATKVMDEVERTLSSLQQFGYMQGDIELEGVLWESELLVAHKANLEKMGEQWGSFAAALNRLIDTMEGMNCGGSIRGLCIDIRESLRGDNQRRF